MRCGTPSIAFGTRTPCQWMVVSSARALSTATRSLSPWRRRISGPGTVPLYNQAAVSHGRQRRTRARRGTQRDFARGRVPGRCRRNRKHRAGRACGGRCEKGSTRQRRSRISGHGSTILKSQWCCAGRRKASHAIRDHKRQKNLPRMIVGAGNRASRPTSAKGR